MNQLIEQLSTIESPADRVVFDAETETRLAGIDLATAAAIRSIARQLAAAHAAETRGYVTGYLDGVKRRLKTAAEETATVAEPAPRLVDPTVAERFLDEAYTALDGWSSNPAGGREALSALDGAVAALQDARRMLVEEIGQDDAGCFEVGGSVDGDLVSKACNCGAEISGSRIEVGALFADHVNAGVDERDLKPVVEVEHEGYALGGRGAVAEVTA